MGAPTGAGSVVRWTWQATQPSSPIVRRIAWQWAARDSGLCVVTARGASARPAPGVSSSAKRECVWEEPAPAAIAARSVQPASRRRLFADTIPTRLGYVGGTRQAVSVACDVRLAWNARPEKLSITRQEEQSRAERRDDRGAGRKIEHERESHAAGGYDGSHRPPDRETRAQTFREEHRGDRGNDQEAEDEKDARDRDRGGHDEPERNVEEEVPESDVDALALGFRLVHRDEEKPPTKDEVEGADES